MRSLVFSLTILLYFPSFAQNIALEKASILIDVSGHNGKNGANGGTGSNATKAQVGENAGQVNVELTQKNEKIAVDILAVKNGEKNKQLLLDLDNELNSINIDASGGNGGKGGKGGNGARGRRGSSGAQCQNGGRGGRGGDGGRGSDGARSGNGGQVIVNISRSQRHLLAILDDLNFSAGKGGNKGEHGKGGSGGPGGSGGGSKWKFTDDGMEIDCFGGSTGPKGSSGTTHTTPILINGLQGEEGSFSINITDQESRKILFRERYKIKGRYKIYDENNDGIYEAGEKITLKSLEVENPSGMQTPEEDIHIRILPKKDYKFTSKDYFRVQSIEGYAKNVAIDDQELKAQLSNVDENDITMVPYTQKITFPTKAYQMPLNKNLPEFSFVPSISQQFPVLAKNLETPDILKAGDIANVVWEIKNISSKTLGINSPSEREVEARLTMLGEYSITNFSLEPADAYTEKLFKIENNTYKLNIPFIAAKKSVLLKFKLRVSAGAESYLPMKLHQSLHFDRLDASSFENQPIQSGQISIQVAQTYRKIEGANVLLVSNKYTSKEAIDSWKEALGTLGFVPEIYDTDYEQNFSLYDVKYHGESLASRYKNKLIIILNNDRILDSHEGIVAQADQMIIDQTEYARAVFEDNISFYFVGKTDDHYEWLFNRLAMPPHTSSQDTPHQVNKYNYKKDLSAFFKDVEDQKFSEQYGLIAEIYLDMGREIVEPQQSDFVNMREKIKSKLETISPNDRFYFVGEYKLTEELARGFNRYGAGTLKIYRGFNFNEAAWQANPASNSEMNTSNWIKSDVNIRQLIYALSLEQKLKLYDRLYKHKKYILVYLVPIILDAILLDLSLEQMLIRSRGKSVNKSKIRTMMKKFDLVASFFSRYSPLIVDADNALFEKEKAIFYLTLMAKLIYVSKQEGHWRNRIPTLGNHHERSNEILEQSIEESIKKIFEGSHGRFKRPYKKNKEAAEQQYESIVENLMENSNIDSYAELLDLRLKPRISLRTVDQSSDYQPSLLSNNGYIDKFNELENGGARNKHVLKHELDRKSQQRDSLGHRVEETPAENEDPDDPNAFDF